MSCYYKVPEPLLGSKIIKILEPRWPIVLPVDNWWGNKEENACSNTERERELRIFKHTVQQKQVKKRGGLGFKSMSFCYLFFIFYGDIYFWCIVMGLVLFIFYKKISSYGVHFLW